MGWLYSRIGLLSNLAHPQRITSFFLKEFRKFHSQNRSLNPSTKTFFLIHKSKIKIKKKKPEMWSGRLKVFNQPFKKPLTFPFYLEHEPNQASLNLSSAFPSPTNLFPDSQQSAQ